MHRTLLERLHPFHFERAKPSTQYFGGPKSGGNPPRNVVGGLSEIGRSAVGRRRESSRKLSLVGRARGRGRRSSGVLGAVIWAHITERLACPRPARRARKPGGTRVPTRAVPPARPRVCARPHARCARPPARALSGHVLARKRVARAGGRRTRPRMRWVHARSEAQSPDTRYVHTRRHAAQRPDSRHQP